LSAAIALPIARHNDPFVAEFGSFAVEAWRLDDLAAFRA
jgi:hypothetical protein